LGDSLVSIELNYQWRKFISGAILESVLDAMTYLEDPTLEDFELLFNEFLETMES